MISLRALAPALDRKLQDYSREERFRFFVLLLHGASYKLGSENPFETDCSGTICWALWCLGYPLRLTAAELYARVYTHGVNVLAVRDYWNRTLALFYERNAQITHVAPIVGRGVLFDAVNQEQPAQLKSIEAMVNWYTENGYGIHFREIDWASAERISREEPGTWTANRDEFFKALEAAVGG